MKIVKIIDDECESTFIIYLSFHESRISPIIKISRINTNFNIPQIFLYVKYWNIKILSRNVK